MRAKKGYSMIRTSTKLLQCPTHPGSCIPILFVEAIDSPGIMFPNAKVCI